MRILSRYILREHAGPLVFALTALTSLLLLQYVARQLDKLVGKGLPWRVIGEFLLLSLPFTIAMTLPMAVLVATLHAFGRLASEHEVTAFKASGVRVRTLMRPVLGASLFLSALMLFFNDQVLPRANHRLSILLTDIVSVRPTVGLRPQSLTKVTETFYIKAGWLDDASNRMKNVEIHDVSNSAQRKSVWADSGTFTLSPDSVDLQLVLFDGETLEFPQGDARKLQRTSFRQQVLKVQDMARGFSATGAQGQFKGEREQGICELQREYEARAQEYESRRERWIAQLRAEAAGGAQGRRSGGVAAAGHDTAAGHRAAACHHTAAHHRAAAGRDAARSPRGDAARHAGRPPPRLAGPADAGRAGAAGQRGDCARGGRGGATGQSATRQHPARRGQRAHRAW